MSWWVGGGRNGRGDVSFCFCGRTCRCGCRGVDVLCVCVWVWVWCLQPSLFCQCALAGFLFRDQHTRKDSPRVARSCGSCTLACKRNGDTNSVQLRLWPQAAAQHKPHWSTPNANLGCSVAKPRQRCLLATHQPLHRSSTTAFLRVWRDRSIISVPPPTRHRASHCVFPPTESFFLSPTVFSTRHVTQRTTHLTRIQPCRHLPWPVTPHLGTRCLFTCAFDVELPNPDDSEVPRRHCLATHLSMILHGCE